MTKQATAPLTIVGLGPSGPRYLTQEARQALRSAPEVWLRTRKHPLGQFLSRRPGVHSFDSVYDQSSSFEEVYDTIARRVLELARRPEGVTYAVPGDPMVGEDSVRRVLAMAREDAIPFRVISGISFLEPVFAAIGFDPLEDGLQIVDATSLVAQYEAAGDGSAARWKRMLAPRPIQPIRPAIVCQVYSRRLSEALKVVLLEIYPAEHRVTLVHRAGVRGRERTAELPLFELDRRGGIDHLTCLYLPPLPLLDDRTGFDTFRHIVARLRAPGGCPWDREQTHQSLKPYLIEEGYEVLEALDDEDVTSLEEELGDLLLQVVLHAQLAAEASDFDMGDVLSHISAKLIRRHPHVFGDLAVSGSSEVLRNWERIKQAEKGDAEGTKTTLLGGVPKEMPALAHAGSIQRRVADLGFDWDDAAGALEKVAEEAAELSTAEGQEERRAEFGDLLFALVSAGRWLGLDAEESLRLANQRFIRRFTRMEEKARERGVVLKELPADEIIRLWREAKQPEPRNSGSAH